jgi:hypothetical protein
MTEDDVRVLLDKFADEMVRSPEYTQARAFTRLAYWIRPGDRTSCIIDGAEHDIIYFSVTLERLAEAATEEDLRELA